MDHLGSETRLVHGETVFCALCLTSVGKSFSAVNTSFFLDSYVIFLFFCVDKCLDKIQSYFTHSNLKWFRRLDSYFDIISPFTFFPWLLGHRIPTALFYFQGSLLWFPVAFTSALIHYIIRYMPSLLNSPGPNPSLLTFCILNSRPLVAKDAIITSGKLHHYPSSVPHRKSLFCKQTSVSRQWPVLSV